VRRGGSCRRSRPRGGLVAETKARGLELIDVVLSDRCPYHGTTGIRTGAARSTNADPPSRAGAKSPSPR